MKNPIRYGAVVLFASLLAGCPSRTKPKTAPPSTTPPPTAETAPATPPKSAAEMEQEAKMAAEQQKRMQLLAEEVIYFDFDSAAISDHAREVIEAHAVYVL